jgi:hypothetical protein
MNRGRRNIASLVVTYARSRFVRICYAWDLCSLVPDAHFLPPLLYYLTTRVAQPDAQVLLLHCTYMHSSHPEREMRTGLFLLAGQNDSALKRNEVQEIRVRLYAQFHFKKGWQAPFHFLVLPRLFTHRLRRPHVSLLPHLALRTVSSPICSSSSAVFLAKQNNIV